MSVDRPLSRPLVVVKNAAQPLLYPLARPLVRSALYSTSALTRFAVNGVEAALALDFIGSEYRTGNAATTFADAFMGTSPKITYNPGSASSSQSTMTQGYGPDLVTNGDFSGGSTGWTAVIDNGLDFSEGFLQHSGSSGGRVRQAITTVVGDTYELSFRLDATNDASFQNTSVSIRNSADNNSIVYLLSGDLTAGAVRSYSTTFTATEATHYVAIYSEDNITIDNISVREAPKIVWAPHNLLDYSEDFSQWYDVGGTLDTTLHEAPDGSTTARKITVNTPSTAYTREFLTIGASSHTFGVYVKAGTASTVQLYVIQQGATSGTADIDLATGQVSNVSAAWTVAPTATSVGDGWWLVVGSRKFTAAASNHGVGVTATNQNGLTYYIWGAHVYRSDLGGMAPVPGAVGDFQYYVPTNGAAEYLPRVGHHVYNGSTWVNEGLLIESEQRTNLITQSEDFTHASWDRVNLPAPTLGVTSPTGQVDSYTLTPSTNNNQHRLDLYTTISAADHSFSVYAKANGYEGIWLRLGSITAQFDLAAGVVYAEGGTTTANIQDVGNGWYRVSISGTAAANDIARINVIPTGSASDFAGDGTSGIYIYGAQLEQAPTPSSYIPTSGSTVIRGGQSLTVPPAQFGWPEPEFIGPELVTTTAVENGGWTVSETTVTATGTSGAADNVVFTLSEALEVGKVYQILIPNNMPVFGFYVDTVGGSAQIGALDATNDYIIVKCTSPTSSLRVGRWVGTPTGTIGPISVREINPLSVSFQIDGRMTYADEGSASEIEFLNWEADSNNLIDLYLSAASTATGRLVYRQKNAGTPDVVETGGGTYSPGTLVPFNIASRHGSTFVNGAVDGVALTADTTPTALPDLSNTDLQIAQDFMGTIGQFRQFAGDIGDAGLVTATNPSTEPTLSLTFNGTGGSYYNLSWSE